MYCLLFINISIDKSHIKDTHGTALIKSEGTKNCIFPEKNVIIGHYKKKTIIRTQTFISAQLPYIVSPAQTFAGIGKKRVTCKHASSSSHHHTS